MCLVVMKAATKKIYAQAFVQLCVVIFHESTARNEASDSHGIAAELPQGTITFSFIPRENTVFAYTTNCSSTASHFPSSLCCGCTHQKGQPSIHMIHTETSIICTLSFAVPNSKCSEVNI